MALEATFAALAIGGSAIAFFYLIFTVIIRNIEKQEAQRKTTGEFMRQLLKLLLILLLVIPIAFFTAFFAIGQHVYTNWPFYIAASAVVIVADAITDNHKQLLETYDKLNTEFFVPVYRFGFLVASNVARIIYDFVICWWNLYQQILNIFFQETVKLLVDCTVINWEPIAQASVKIIEAPYLATIFFIASDGQDRFDLVPFFEANGILIDALTDIGSCACEDLDFAWNLMDEIFTSPNLHNGLDRSFNLPADLIRPIWNTLIPLFQGDTSGIECPTDTGASFPDPDPVRLACLLERPPKFTRLFDDATASFKFMGQWFDDILRASLDVFFDFTSSFSADTIPLLGYYLPVIPNWGMRVVEVTVDIIMHIDLVFTDNYLGFANFVKPAEELFCLSLGFEDFFQRLATGSGVPEIADLGTGTAKIFNSTLETYIFWTRLSQAGMFRPFAVVDLIENNDFDAIFQQYADGWADIVGFTRFLNDPLGDMLEYWVRQRTTFYYFWLQVLVHLPTLLTGTLTENTDLQTMVFDPLIEQYRDESRQSAAAIGNFIRQIGQFDPLEPCPLIPLDPPPEFVLDAENDKEIFCCVGDFLHALFLLRTEASITLLEAFRVVLEIRDLSFSLSTLVNFSADRYERILSRSDGMIESLGCAMTAYYAAWSPYVECTNPDLVDFLDDLDPDQSTVLDNSLEQSNYIRRPLTAFVNITQFSLVRAEAVIIFAFRILVDGGLEVIPPTAPSAASITEAICFVIVGAYDIVIANPIVFIFGVYNIVSCFIPGVPLGLIVWDILGWDGNSGTTPVAFNLRDEICRVIDAVLLAVQFLVTIFSEASAFFVEAIEFLTILFVDGIEAAFDSIVTILIDVLSDVIGDITDLIDDLEADFLQFKIDVDTALNDLIDFINAFIITRLNAVFCVTEGIATAIGDCFTDNSIVVDIPSIDIDEDFGIGPFDLDIDINLSPEIDFEIPGGNIGGLTSCLSGLAFPATCPGVIGNIPNVALCKRSEVPQEQYYKQVQEGSLWPTRRSLRGDREGLVIRTVTREEHLIKLAEQRYGSVFSKSSNVMEKGFFEDFENYTYSNPIQIDMNLIPFNSACFPLAVYVYGPWANYTEEGIYTIWQNLTQEETVDVLLEGYQDLNITNNTSYETWGRMSRWRELRWCLFTSSAIRTVNNVLSLHEFGAIPEDLIFDPFVSFQTSILFWYHGWNIAYYQLFKENFTEILYLDASSLNQTLDAHNVTDFANLTTSLLNAWDDWAAEHNITNPTTLNYGRMIDRIRIMYNLFGDTGLSKFANALVEIWTFFRTVFYDIWLNPEVGGLFTNIPALKRNIESAKNAISETWSNSEKWKRAISAIPPIPLQFKAKFQKNVEYSKELFLNSFNTNNPKTIQHRKGFLHVSMIFKNAFRNNLVNRQSKVFGGEKSRHILRNWEYFESRTEDYFLNFEFSKNESTVDRRYKFEEALHNRTLLADSYRDGTITYQGDRYGRPLNETTLSAKSGIQRRDTLGGLIDPIDLDPCIAGACLQCQLLDRLIDRVIFEICECIDATLTIVDEAFAFQPSLGIWGGDPNDVPFPSTFPRDPEYPNILPLKDHHGNIIIPLTEDEQDNSTRVHRQEARQYLNTIISRTNEISLLPAGPFSLNKLVLNIIFFIPKLLIGDFSFEDFTNNFVGYLINDDLSDSDNAYFYVSFIFRCRPQNYKCEVQPIGSGLGLVDATILVYTVLIIMSLILPRIWHGSNSFLGAAWVTSVPIVLAVAYYWIPGCGWTLPNCLMDDAQDVFEYFNVDCTPWHIWLPGLVTPICPGAAQDYTRIFPDCKAPPYNFVDGFRNFFITIEIYWPELNEYIRGTSNLLVNWINCIDNLQEAMNFPFPPGEVPDDFKSCNKVTMGNYAAFAVVFTLGFVGLFILFYAIFLFITTLIEFIDLFIELITTAISSSTDPSKQTSGQLDTRSPIYQNLLVAENQIASSAPLVQAVPVSSAIASASVTSNLRNRFEKRRDLEMGRFSGSDENASSSEDETIATTTILGTGISFLSKTKEQ